MAMKIPPDLDCNDFTVCILGNFARFFLIFGRLLIFEEKNFSKNYFIYFIRESSSFDLYQAEVMSTVC